MSDIIRFLLGLGLMILLAIVGVAAVLLLSPLIVGASILVYGGVIVGGVLYLVVGFFALVWYFTREEPDIGKKKNYSIKQGKEV